MLSRQGGFYFMKSIVGIFNSLADAKRAAALMRSIGIQDNRISVLSPRTSEAEVAAVIPISESEQPGMGRAIGGTVGGALGVATGLEAGAAAASLLIPGVGPVLAFGLIGAALLGAGGAAAGALAGGALEDGVAQGLPRDEVYVYEDALRRGRSVVVAFADDQLVGKGQTELSRAGAESVDTARHEWWIGLRDAEQEHYTKQGGDFKMDEAKYRLGFEAALHPDRRGKSYDECATKLSDKYAGECTTPAFREGYERGQTYNRLVTERHGPEGNAA
jgi:hypothetical protein